LKRKILTIGYSGFSLDNFVAVLRDTGVECLFDIRDIPLSRKAGFSKTALREHLASAEIEYRHFRLLGSPRDLRHELRATRDYRPFFRGMRQHLRADDSIAEIGEAISVARQLRACLMCCCPDWQLCHRKCVVEAISEVSYFAFEHISLEHAKQLLTDAA